MRKARSHWREFDFVFHEIQRAIEPPGGLQQTLQEGQEIQSGLAESSRAESAKPRSRGWGKQVSAYGPLAWALLVRPFGAWRFMSAIGELVRNTDYPFSARKYWLEKKRLATIREL